MSTFKGLSPFLQLLPAVPQGGVLELDAPATLLEDPASRFHSLAATDRVLFG